MQLSITQKLVISFVGLTVVVLAGTLLLARWSFAQGFLDYVNALEQGRLQQVAEDLAEMYQFRNQDWPQVLDSNLVRQIERSAGQPGGSLRPRGTSPPGRPDKPGMSKPPPPPHLDKPQDPSSGQRPRPPGHPPGAVPTDKPFHPPPAPAGLPPHQVMPAPGRQHRGPGFRRRAMLPTSLYDAAGNHLAGPLLSTTASGQIVVPITVGDEVVGELRTQPRRELNSTQETEFSQQQLNASILIALVALLISVLLSVFLAHALLAPVHRLMTAVNSMASGNYELSLGPLREDELGALMRNVQRLSQALLESQAARKRWLADISHELRTPVTILTGELEALQLGMRNLDQQQLDSFSEEVNRINKLVDDLYQLALSDMGALRYQFAQVDVFHCMQQVVQTLNQQQSTSSAPELPIHLTGNNGTIFADESRLYQLFMNLLRNSLFYTDRPGKIEVDVNVTTNNALININDTPPGVAPAQCERLFEPLYRQDASRSRREAGAGLGLSICRNIVQAHHGDISASPSPLGGVHIHIRLPVNATSAPADPAPSNSAPSSIKT